MRSNTAAASHAAVLPHCGLLIAVVADGPRTGGRYAVAEARGARGAGLPRHVHEHEDECVLVLDGELDLHVDGAELRIAAGSAVPLPRRRPHALRIASAAATFLQLWTPAGHEETLRRLAGPALPPADPDDVAAVLASAGVTLLPDMLERGGDPGDASMQR